MSEEQEVKEVIVIGLLPPTVIKWLQRKFKDVQYVECSQATEICKQVRQAIVDISREEIEQMYYTY